MAEVDPAVVARIERMLAGALPLDRRGAVMARVAGALLQRQATADVCCA